jgi:energy-coupling factor transporter ATP-binding protein EcfA2
MKSDYFTASKSRTKDGAVWVLTFRHPLKPDPRGKPGRKMRRSTATTNEALAQQIVSEMNELLSDHSWFDIARQSAASQRFNDIVVRAFYDDLTVPNDRSFDIREQRLALPPPDQGYKRVMLVGSTGAGKTSLLRQLIGTDPKSERFPSTSASRTTISDIEVITSDDSNFACVATFFPETTVQTLVHECVADACAVLWSEAGDEKIAERLLEHRDMRFRLSYILGGWQSADEDPDEEENDDDGFGDESDDEALEGEPLPTDPQRSEMQRVLEGFVARIRALAEAARRIVAAAGDDESPASLQERFEDAVQELPDFDELVGDIMDEIRKRFDGVADGLTRRSSGWPECWTHMSSSRKEFLPVIRKLSSNYGGSHGALLTPLVDGIRVRGPLHPVVSKEKHKFVFFDGEGIGHAKDAGASISSHLTSRFEDVDLILMVDSAKGAMLDGPTALLRAIAATGHHQKLAIAFSHFDGLKGQANLLKPAAKKAHVMASVHQALESLKSVLGLPVIRSLERDLDDRCFMLSHLNRPIGDGNPTPAKQLRELIQYIARPAINYTVSSTAEPAYNLARLHFAIQSGVNEFHGRWDAIFGFGGTPGVKRAHWGEIKALNRRVVLRQENCEYRAGNLLPVADLVHRLAEKITRCLDTPKDWKGPAPSEEEAIAILSAIQRDVARKLEGLATRRIIDDRHPRWTSAFHLRGKGSTFERARAIQGILIEAAPPLSAEAAVGWEDFLDDIEKLVHAAIKSAGGKVAGEAPQ